jgi:hypothetical protein
MVRQSVDEDFNGTGGDTEYAPVKIEPTEYAVKLEPEPSPEFQMELDGYRDQLILVRMRKGSIELRKRELTSLRIIQF